MSKQVSKIREYYRVWFGRLEGLIALKAGVVMLGKMEELKDSLKLLTVNVLSLIDSQLIPVLFNS